MFFQRTGKKEIKITHRLCLNNDEYNDNGFYYGYYIENMEFYDIASEQFIPQLYISLSKNNYIESFDGFIRKTVLIRNKKRN